MSIAERGIPRWVPNNERLKHNPCEGKESQERLPIVASVRTVNKKDCIKILRWISDEETSQHLDPLPRLPDSWDDPADVARCVEELHTSYYKNYNPERNIYESHKITPFVALDASRNPIGALTIRWRGDPYVPTGQAIASIERIVVDPNFRKKGVATTLIATAIDYAFSTYRYQDEDCHIEPTQAIRAWIMTDKQAGDWTVNFDLFRKFGFTAVPFSTHWKDFAKKRGIATDRDGLWLSLTRHNYKNAVREAKSKGKPIVPCPTKHINKIYLKETL